MTKIEGPRVNWAPVIGVAKNIWAAIPGGVKHYWGVKSWQRSCRHHAVKSRVRHAKRMARNGFRYKGGR